MDHRHYQYDHRGNVVKLHKPKNESALSQQEKEQWHKEHAEHLAKGSDK